ncbi:hypothetical protein WJX74_002904 [Apatococcus lobatus]|uniref:Uncharacterized protein n=1 Tax=Apatococcus lobatus TaxID=904363 RepID=A0AAW1SDW6_9CHLO
MESIVPDLHLDSIRIDSATQRGSVLDVIQAVTGHGDSCRKTWHDFKKVHSDIVTRCNDVQINGKGKPTPVAAAPVLVEIAWLLPGKAAAAFRRGAAKAICRLVGGDLSMIPEIEARHAAAAGSAEEGFLLHEAPGGKVEEAGQGGDASDGLEERAFAHVNALMAERLDLFVRQRAFTQGTHADMQTEIGLLSQRAAAIDGVTRATQNHSRSTDAHTQAIVRQAEAIHRHTSVLRESREQLAAVAAQVRALHSSVALLNAELAAARGQAGDINQAVAVLAQSLQACADAGAGVSQLFEVLRGAGAADTRLRGLASAMAEVLAVLRELAAVPRDRLEWVGHVATMGFDLHEPWEAERIINNMESAVHAKSEMLRVAERRVEVDFASHRVHHNPGGFTFHDALVIVADTLSTTAEPVSVFDLADWASKPRWAAPDGKAYPLWYFARRVVGVPVVVHPSGEGVQTVNFYQGGEDAKRRLAAWVTMQAREAGRTGHPVVPTSCVPVVAAA